MHEISLLEQVREILIEHAEVQQFTKVSKVTLEVGALSCVEEDALRFGFDVVMKGCLAENAELILTRVKGRGLCLQCQQYVDMQTFHDPCTYCGSFRLKVIQGEDMRIKDLLVI